MSKPQPGGSSLSQDHLATLYEITRTLNSSLEMDDVLDYVMDRVIEVTRAERGFLMLYDDRQDELVFRVARGINRSDLESPEFQVSTTIVRRVRSTCQPLLTDNAQFDERFTRGESIMVMGLRSILCVPILIKERLIGLVYVDNRLHVGLFKDEHRELLAAFAIQAGIAIENARLYQVAVEKGRMEKELQMAHDIQLGLLPSALPAYPGYEIAADWRSAREVAGDFYDCFVLPDNRLGVVVADVSDKGAPAALFMAVYSRLLRGLALTAASPEDALRQANRIILDETQSGMFVTVYYSLLAPDGTLIGVSAGHNQPLVYRAARRTCEFLPRGGRPLGWFADLPLQRTVTRLAPGDVAVFYTDGLVEAENTQAQPYGNERLAAAVQAMAGQPATAIMQHIMASMIAFRGAAPPFDDTTLVVVRYTGET